MKKYFSAIIEKEGNYYNSLCPELDIASQGKSIDEAIKNLKEAVGLYIEVNNDAELPTELPIITTMEIEVA